MVIFLVYFIRLPVPPVGVLRETGRAQSGSPFGAEKEGALALFCNEPGDLFPGEPGEYEDVQCCCLRFLIWVCARHLQGAGHLLSWFGKLAFRKH
jgi:hypothetical protein